MKPTTARLALTAALFLGWLGYLGYLVVCRPHAPAGLRGAFEGHSLTLSRPQIIVSTLDVVADISGDKGEKVVVKQVLFPKGQDSPVKVGETIRVDRINECRAVPDPLAKNVVPPPDYSGPGEYLLPLQSKGNDQSRFEIVPTPPSPGFPSSSGVASGPPRIYPATREMLAEYQSILKP